MTNQEIITKIAEEVRAKLEGEGSGHDWWHVERVWKMAKHIGERENADLFVAELGALLHDVADWKFHNGDHSVGPKVASEMLAKHGVPEDVISKVAQIIREVSFKGAGVNTTPSTLEGKVAQDADRLDALGAIGIARTFAYGGHVNREIYNPNIKPVLHQSTEEYAKSKSHTINHFYEKLLLLKDLMNTNAAKEIAKERHAFLEGFLHQFFKEWEGKVS